MTNNKSKILHNPKSHAPAVYIPCWLIQVPNSLLSYAAKILYGRLAQWSNENGDVFRSYNQLSQEIGSSKRSINEYLRELRECGLIGTHHPQAGGLNHFEFYEHEWMHEKINPFLCYKSEIDPEQDSALPRAGFCSTPEQDSARINNKEIKEIKEREPQKQNLDIIRKSNPFAVLLPDSYLITQQQLNSECLIDKRALESFELKFGKLEITYEEMLAECVMYYALKPVAQYVSPHRFRAWIKREHVDVYDKKPDCIAHKLWKDFTEEERGLIADYNHFMKFPEIRSNLNKFQLEKAKELIESLKSAQKLRSI